MVRSLVATLLLLPDEVTFALLAAPPPDKTATVVLLKAPAARVAAVRTQTVVPLATVTELP
jgi:hypothetical protein